MVSDSQSKFVAEDGPADCCVFCDNEVEAQGAEAEIVIMEDYVNTNLGEDTPCRRVGLCFHHAQLLRERVPKTTDTVVL